MMRKGVTLLPLLLLAACGEGEQAGVSASESRALNDAAEMLDSRSYMPEAANGQAVIGNDTGAPAQRTMP